MKEINGFDIVQVAKAVYKNTLMYGHIRIIENNGGMQVLDIEDEIEFLESLRNSEKLEKEISELKNNLELRDIFNGINK